MDFIGKNALKPAVFFEQAKPVCRSRLEKGFILQAFPLHERYFVYSMKDCQKAVFYNLNKSLKNAEKKPKILLL